jgi:carbonic anhydrase
LSLFQPGTCSLQNYGFEINSHAEQANVPDAGLCAKNSFQIPGVEGTFEMLQFHIHTSSEHTFNGKLYGGELHMVHQEANGDGLAVIGLFIMPTAAESHPVFDVLLQEFDAIQDETYNNCTNSTLPHWWQEHNIHIDVAESKASEAFNPYDLIPEGATFYHYSGGLTTPPCSEIVEWSVVDKPIEISVSQFTDLISLTLNYIDEETCELATIADPATGSTSRPVQELNGREVQRICPVDFVDETMDCGNSDNADNANAQEVESTSTSDNANAQELASQGVESTSTSSANSVNFFALSAALASITILA